MTRSGPKVALVVDDLAVDREIVRRALQGEIEVVEASTLDDAWARYLSGGIDVVVLDLNLQGQDGLGLVERIRQHADSPVLPVPVVLRTGTGNERKAVNAMKLGVDDYLVKDDDNPERLLRAVRTAMDRFELRMDLERKRIALVTAERAAELRAERLAQLQEVTGELARLVEATDAASIVMRRFEILFGAERGWFAERSAVDGGLDVIATFRYPPESGMNRHFGPDEDVPATAVLDGTPLFIENPAAYRARFPHLAGSFPGVTTGAIVVLPLLAERRVLGVIAFGLSTPRTFDSDERSFLIALAQQCSLAFERARLWSQLRSAVEARDRTLAVATHDLRNPLSAIGMLAQSLELEAAESFVPGELVRDVSRRIGARVAKMNRLITELLDVAALEGGADLALDRKTTDLVEIARRVAGDHARAAGPRLHLAVPDEPVTGQWDENRLERVVENLVSNAIKYSPRGGAINVVVSRDPDAGRAEISVADRGVGIPAADLPHIFDRFHRAHNVIGSFQGTGIGLSSARHIVERHGGTIAVVSHEGFGTTVSVRLPTA
jgi:signal transduction histidine kinase/CheY-like chemotaxis protein